MSRFHDSPHHSIHRNAAPVANVSHTEHSKLLPWLMLCAILSGAALMGAGWAISESEKSERESRLLQQQVMDQNALLVREGLRRPEDFTNGPAGNLQYQPKESSHGR